MDDDNSYREEEFDRIICRQLLSTPPCYSISSQNPLHCADMLTWHLALSVNGNLILFVTEVEGNLLLLYKP